MKNKKPVLALVLSFCLCLGLLCGCGERSATDGDAWSTDGNAWATDGDARVSDGIETEAPQPTEAPTPTPLAESVAAPTAGDAGLTALLLAVRDDYRPGTAGSSLVALSLAAQIMDWYQSVGSVNLACETAMTLGDPGEDAAGEPYPSKLEAVYAAAAGLWGYYGEQALADCGYSAQGWPYEMSDVKEVFGGIYNGFGNMQPMYLRLFRPDDNAERFVAFAVPAESLTPEEVVNALVRAGVLAEGVAVNRMEYVENGLVLDLNSAFLTQLRSQGTTGEYMLMGALVNSFLTNYSAETLTLLVDGQIPESGHVIYDMPLSFYDDNVAVG